MKRIKTYNIFLNESLKDKLKGKSKEEIINSFTKIMGNTKYYTVKDYIDDINKELNEPNIDEDRKKVINQYIESYNNMCKLTNSDPSDLVVISEDENIYQNITELFDSLGFISSKNNIKDLDDDEYYHRVYTDNKIILSSPTDYDGVEILTFNPLLILDKLKGKSVNESLKDKLKGKSEDEIKNNVKKLPPVDQLLLSVKYGYLDMIKDIPTLLEFNGTTLRNAIKKAIKYEHYDIAKYLYELGIPLYINDDIHPLGFFYKNGDIDIVKKIIYASLYSVDDWNFEKFTVNIVKDSNIELFEILMRHEYDKKFIKYLLKIAKHNSSEEMISAIRRKKRSI
jgi:hypothetical protein